MPDNVLLLLSYKTPSGSVPTVTVAPSVAVTSISANLVPSETVCLSFVTDKVKSETGRGVTV